MVREGGIIVESHAYDFDSDLLALIRMLRTKKTDGMLLDKYTLVYVKGYLYWKQSTINEMLNNSTIEVDEESLEILKDIEFFLNNTDETMKINTGDKLSYGVLVKNLEDFQYLNFAVRDNRLSAETVTESIMNSLFPRPKKDTVIDPTKELLPFQFILKWIGVVFGCLCFVGILYEGYRYVMKRRKEQKEEAGEAAEDSCGTREASPYFGNDSWFSAASSTNHLYSRTYLYS